MKRKRKVVRPAGRINPFDDETEDFSDLTGSVHPGTVALPLIRYRTGSDVHDWAQPGTAKHPVAIPPLIQAGSNKWSGAAAASGQFTFDFPVAFAGSPILISSNTYTNPIFTAIRHQATSDESTVIVTWATAGPTITEAWFHWIAIGPAKVI